MDRNTIYNSIIKESVKVNGNQINRGKFYLIQEYISVGGDKGKFAKSTGPIIFVLSVSKKQNLVHAIKISAVDPEMIKKFFEKFVNKETDKFEMKGKSEQIYQQIVSKARGVKAEAYRTYQLSGLTKLLELNMDLDKLTPRNVKVKQSKKSILDKRKEK